MDNTRALAHHGVKGMHWGVRRTPGQLGRKTGGNKRDKSADNTNQARKADMKAASKNRRTLSTEEIQRRIERLKLERQLKDLTDEELSPGRKFVKDVMSQSGRKAVTAIATGALLYGAKTAVTQEFDAKEFGKAIFNGGPKK